MDVELSNVASTSARLLAERLETDEGKLIGIGTGKTVKKILDNLPERVFSSHYFIASSLETLNLLKKRGAKTLEITSIGRIDLYIDSADHYDDSCNLIKGYGGALLREKILMGLSGENIIVVTRSKHVDSILDKKVPLEIEPVALPLVEAMVRSMGLVLEVRETTEGKRGPVISDNGNILADVTIVKWSRGGPEELDYMLTRIPGVVASGVFTKDIVDKLVVGRNSGVDIIKCSKGLYRV